MADKKISALTAATVPLGGTEVFPIVQSSTTVKATIANVQAAPVSSGNANSVQYLNGSKVPSTSTTIVTDGTNLAIGPTSPVGANRLLEVGTSSRAETYVRMQSQTAGFVFSEYLVAGYDSLFAGINNSGSAFNGIPNGGAGVTTGTSFTVATASAGKFTFNTSGNLVPLVAAKGIYFTANTPQAGMPSQLLSWYEVGNWTPSDASGAGLSLTQSSQAKYVRIGNLVTLTMDITYPATASVSSAVIGSLPFAGTANIGGLVSTYTSFTYPISGPLNTGTTINLYSNQAAGSAPVTNLNLSAKRLMATVTYVI